MANLKYNLEWFKGLNKQEEEDLRNILASNSFLLDKLTEIVYNMVTSSEEVNLTDYDSPSWSHRQAHVNGHNHALRKVLALTKGKEGRDE